MKNSLLLFILFFNLFCINKNNAQYTEFGVGLGFSTYWGDLNSPSLSSNISNNSGIAVQLGLRKFINPYFAVKGALSIGKVKGQDSESSLEWQNLRNLSFRSNLTELSVMGELYVFGFDTEAGSSPFSPYLTVGIGAFRFDPKTIYQGNEIRLQPLGTEGQGMPGFGTKYSLMSLNIPFGGGAKIILNDRINVGFDVIIRRSFTDYLDDLSGSYVNHDDLNAGNGTLAASLGNRMNEYLGQVEPVQLATGSQRGGAQVKDYYIMTFVTLNILMSDGKRRFGRSSVECPRF